jgi:hypothetical protein
MMVVLIGSRRPFYPGRVRPARDFDREVGAIDGKTVRGSFDRGRACLRVVAASFSVRGATDEAAAALVIP